MMRQDRFTEGAQEVLAASSPVILRSWGHGGVLGATKNLGGSPPRIGCSYKAGTPRFFAPRTASALPSRLRMTKPRS